MQPAIARGVLARLRAGGTGRAIVAEPLPLVEPSTGRELDVLRLLGTGATNRDIADQLALTEGTVKNYVSSVLATTGLREANAGRVPSGLRLGGLVAALAGALALRRRRTQRAPGRVGLAQP